ncbi:MULTISPECIES: ATP-binding protein [unclassified Zobellia]|uniref:ATP-binding protein n=1 Tax=unclassified Zobellia TaxID=2620635 RepID=UPI001C06F543|nr:MULTISPECIES: ATP-binding protein [unclassified Zobellia]MBU2975006.1 type IV pili methyl-accepting chemotaxis transducer N-terminal domain-containing protein [Zobellia sp. B3R18]MDO6818076.1 ATP-binding protein [Zobellia sp. 1_MG-2023]
MSKEKSQLPLDSETFLSIRKWYLWALAGIAITIIVSQILIQLHLNSQLSDSRVINVAGFQRAYSQKLTKELLLIKDAFPNNSITKNVTALSKTISIWKHSHLALQNGDAEIGIPKETHVEILELFQKLEPHHAAMVGAAEKIIQSYHDKSLDKANLEENVAVVLQNENSFLQLMDDIVNQYDQRSKEQLKILKRKEYVLLGISLLILLLEILFIFRPLSLQIRKTIGDLMQNQVNSEARAKEVQQLYSEKEKSLQELQELNFVIDNAALFASTRKDGSIVFISKKFLELLGITEKQLNKPLSEILTADQGQQEYLREVLKNNRKNVIRTEEIKITTLKGKHFWLDMSIVPMHQSSRQQSILILCSDITERKENSIKVEQLTQQNFEARMLQKKVQASQIVEGQEEERKRIAKDIHDGIGQMLTALKFNIESIDPENKAKTIEKIAYLKTLTSDLIKGVRTATFNLTPPELSDHGIFPALQKMTAELSKLTGKTILFDNRTDEHIRFDSLAETNVYRVVQEAVNNAIKYAEANYILVTINYKDDILSVVIDDDGKGFDDSILGQVPKNNSEGGMGLFFMKERIDYINGRLFINSIPGEGTRVTINYKTEKEEEHGAE